MPAWRNHPAGRNSTLRFVLSSNLLPPEVWQLPPAPLFLSARRPPGRGTATLELSSQFLPARVRPAKPAKTRPGAPRLGEGGGGGDGWGWHPAWLRSSGSVSRKDKCLYPPHSLPPRREAPAQTESPRDPVHPGVSHPKRSPGKPACSGRGRVVPVPQGRRQI